MRGALTPKKIAKTALSLLLLLPVGFVLWIWAELAWIQFRPLPPIPHYGSDYSVADMGSVGDKPINFHDRDPLHFGTRLTGSGQVVALDDAAEAQDEAGRKDLLAAEARKLGPVRAGYSGSFGAVAGDGDALLRSDRGWQLCRSSGPTLQVSEGVRGYDWKPHPLILNFHVLTTQDQAIGNGRIATAYATSGGTSSPHGRWLPLIWQGGGQPEDLNGHVDAGSRWYLDQAVDLNARGQILCIARKTDARGAEDYHMENARWVVLTPKK